MADTSATIGNRLKATVLDLNDDCLINICQYLEPYELYALRDMHSRFINATEYCYVKMAAERLWEFNYSNWLGGKHSADLRNMLEYFGPYMRKVRIGKSFTRFVRENSISQSFLAERLANIQFLCFDYADHDEVNFVPALKHIEALEVKEVNWMPPHACWANLNKVTVSYPTFSARRAEGLIAFMKRHKHTQILRIAIPTMSRYSYRGDERWLFDMISKMSDLCELDLCDFTPGFLLDFGSLFVNGNKWGKLQKLHLPYVRMSDLDLFNHLRLSNLTYLRVGHEIDTYVFHLLGCGIVFPTVTHIDLFYNTVEVDQDNLSVCNESRWLYCGDQPIHINNLYLDETHNPGGWKRNEKFGGIKQNKELVLCQYYTGIPYEEIARKWQEEIGMGRKRTCLTDFMIDSQNY